LEPSICCCGRSGGLREGVSSRLARLGLLRVGMAGWGFGREGPGVWGGDGRRNFPRIRIPLPRSGLPRRSGSSQLVEEIDEQGREEGRSGSQGVCRPLKMGARGAGRWVLLFSITILLDRLVLLPRRRLAIAAMHAPASAPNSIRSCTGRPAGPPGHRRPARMPQTGKLKVVVSDDVRLSQPA